MGTSCGWSRSRFTLDQGPGKAAGTIATDPKDIDNILKGKELDKKNTNLDATSLSSDSDKSIKKDNIKNPRPNET